MEIACLKADHKSEIKKLKLQTNLQVLSLQEQIICQKAKVAHWKALAEDCKRIFYQALEKIQSEAVVKARERQLALEEESKAKKLEEKEFVINQSGYYNKEDI